MQLGKSLVGAIIGALLGIGLLVAVYLLFQLDKVWLAIPVALLTGLGVRMLVSTSGHASYVRGALTGVLALAAYLGGWYVVKEVAQATAGSQANRPLPATAQADDDTDDADGGAAEAPPVVVPTTPTQQRPGTVSVPKAGPPGAFSTLDFIWLCIAGLVAYELGRGTGAKPVVAAAPEVTPAGTHPDA